MKKNQNGFNVLLVVLVLVIVGAIGFGGWYVWEKSRQAMPSGGKSDQAASSGQASDPTASWKTFASTSGKFALKYPASWVVNSCDNDSVALLGATATEAGQCDSEATAQIQVSSSTGDERQGWQLKPGPAYPDLVTATVSVNGVQAIRQTATLSSGSNNTAIGVPDGTKVTDYLIYVNGRTYLFAYNQEPAATNIAADANLIATKTLSFNR